MRRIWISLLCLLLCLPAGCGSAEDEMYGCTSPVNSGLDGTVIEINEKENIILVEITGPERMVSSGNLYGFEKGERILVKYDRTGDFEDTVPKEGMYVHFGFWVEHIDTKEDFGKKDGYIYIEANYLEKNISFVDGKWSEGTYD